MSDLSQRFSDTVSNTAWQCRLRPILSAHNQLTRLNTVSTRSRLETSPTSTRPASTANFILIPLIGTPGLSAMAPGLPSFPSPGCAVPRAVSSLAIAREGRTGQVAFTGKAPVHRRWPSSRCRRRKRALSPLQLSWRSPDTQTERPIPHPKQFEPSKVSSKGANLSAADTARLEMSLHNELLLSLWTVTW